MSRHILIAALLSLFSFTASASAGPIYNIVPLGFDDAEHTRNDGYKSSSVYTFPNPLNEAGQVIGYSPRYNGGSTDLGQSAWLYNGLTTINIGFTGPEYTANDGYKSSSASSLNEAGQVSGSSLRLNGGFGSSAWLYDGATTIDIGLTGIEHTSNGGRRDSSPSQLNEAGQVSGVSQRYNGGSSIKDLGQSVWLYDGATTIHIGLTGAEHTRNDGKKLSYSYYSNLMNEAGQVAGHSYRYNGGFPELGLSAWLFNGAATINIGLTDSEHTRNDGYKYSDAVQLNEAGQVIGHSNRYNGGTFLGHIAWLYDGVTTIPIGLTGSEHTRNDGFKPSVSQKVNEAGQVIGYSYRYNGGGTLLGYSAWLYNGATTLKLGFIGPEYTRDDGFRESQTLNLNEAGQVIGVSYRFNGGGNLGRSVWLYDGATTIDIGLTGSEHTRNDGYKSSIASQLNEAGQVSGYSQRYNGGSTDLGASAWLYDGATTIDIGLTGSEYTRSNGYEASFASYLNEAGQVGGTSLRYNGGSTQLGQDAWFYDPQLDQTFALQLSTRSDGFASSYANYLGEDGLVLGNYTLFAALDNDLGNRLFYFTIADGLHDLGSLVDGGLSDNGWDSLAGAIRANGLGQILGHGELTSQSGGQFAYLLTPVPEPSTFALATLGVLGLMAFRMGRRSMCADLLVSAAAPSPKRRISP